MPSLTQTPITPAPSAAFDPGVSAVHDSGAAELLLNAIAAGFTGAGASLAIATRGNFPMPASFTWTTLAGDGGANTFTAVTVNLEGSLDGTHWFQLDQTTNAAGETRHVANKPVRYVRANIVTSTVNAGAPTITVIFGA